MSHSKTITAANAEKVYEVMSKIKMGDLLVETFKREIDENTLRVNEGSTFYVRKPDYRDYELYMQEFQNQGYGVLPWL